MFLWSLTASFWFFRGFRIDIRCNKLIFDWLTRSNLMLRWRFRDLWLIVNWRVCSIFLFKFILFWNSFYWIDRSLVVVSEVVLPVLPYRLDVWTLLYLKLIDPASWKLILLKIVHFSGLSQQFINFIWKIDAKSWIGRAIWSGWGLIL